MTPLQYEQLRLAFIVIAVGLFVILIANIQAVYPEIKKYNELLERCDCQALIEAISGRGIYIPIFVNSSNSSYNSSIHSPSLSSGSQPQK